MKKLILTLVTLVTATAASAQIVIWNGEDKNGGFWDRADPTVVDDEGNKCLKITTKAKTGDWENEHFNAHLPLSGVDFKGLRRLSFRIKMEPEHNVLLKLKHGTAEAQRLFYYNGGNTWQKLIFEFSVGYNNEDVADTDTSDGCYLEIWPFEDNNDTHANGNIGKVIFIDDIQLEGPMVNGSAIRTLGDNDLTDQQVIVTGSLSKGEYQCTWDGPWHSVAYDDYATLTSKISADVCFLNLTGAAVSDGDGPQLRTKNSNLMILSPVEFFDKDNVITWDGSKNVTSKLVLKDDAPFYTPIDFTATAVELTRNVQAGINSFYLPFAVTATEVRAAKIAKWKKGVTFETQDNIAANTPFITTGATAATKLNFGEKTVKTLTTSDGIFVGIYAPTYTENKYGINSAGKIQKGAADIKCNAFRAYLTEIPSTARSIDIDGETTGISNVSLENPVKEIYNLNGVRVDKIGNKGIYIINGKKVIVK